MDDLGCARVPRAVSGVVPGTALDKSVGGRVFGATPKTATGTVALPGFWMIFQPVRSWLISGVPLGQVRIKFDEGGAKASPIFYFWQMAVVKSSFRVD